MKRHKHLPPIGPVTILKHGRVLLGTWRGGTVRRHTTHTLIQTNVQRSDEGITWIRGHHLKNSGEVKALLAAYALRLHDSGWRVAGRFAVSALA